MEPTRPDAPAAPDASLHDDASESGFPPTRIEDDPSITPDWWVESTDGQCSEHAALFAASQPGPLTVV